MRPPQFGGPEGLWSPETLLCATVADCFILTFRGLARAARFDWHDLECDVEGQLERAAGVAQFTRFTTRATLTVADGMDIERGKSLLERAEQACLVSNSLRASRTLEVSVTTPDRLQTTA